MKTETPAKIKTTRCTSQGVAGSWNVRETPAKAKAKATLSISRGMGRPRNASENTGEGKDETEYLSGGEWTSLQHFALSFQPAKHGTLKHENEKQAHKQEHKKYRTVIIIIIERQKTRR